MLLLLLLLPLLLPLLVLIQPLLLLPPLLPPLLLLLLLLLPLLLSRVTAVPETSAGAGSPPVEAPAGPLWVPPLSLIKSSVHSLQYQELFPFQVLYDPRPRLPHFLLLSI